LCGRVGRPKSDCRYRELLDSGGWIYCWKIELWNGFCRASGVGRVRIKSWYRERMVHTDYQMANFESTGSRDAVWCWKYIGGVVLVDQDKAEV